MTEILRLTNQEILMRARTDLRLGVPIVLSGNGKDAMVTPIDVLSQARLDQLKSINEKSFILLTARRAQTLKCPVYEGNFARIELDKTPKISSLYSRLLLIIFFSLFFSDKWHVPHSIKFSVNIFSETSRAFSTQAGNSLAFTFLIIELK